MVLVDIRDIRELQREGKVPGAFHCPRGMLEFWIDPHSLYHKPLFAQDKRFVFFCAGGLRSAPRRADRAADGAQAGRSYRGRLRCWKKLGGPMEAPEAMAGEKKKSVSERNTMALKLIIGNKNYSSWSCARGSQ